MINHLLSIVIAFFLDKWMGDPRNVPHPVRMMGRVISFLDRQWNQGKYLKLKGLFMILTASAFFVVMTFTIVQYAYSVHLVFGIFIEAIILSFMIAEKSLKEAAYDVYQPLIKGDLHEARKKLSWIVGRDTEDLPESEIVRGTVETVAENTSDAITAPLFWSLIGGAPLAVLYRVVNTADAMVGYKNEKYQHFGFASAKLDDFFNWVPSRLTAAIMILANATLLKVRLKMCFHIVLRDAKKHPSPNSGFPESAMAALLGVQLGGVNKYKGIISNRAKLGDRIFPLKADHIEQSILIMLRTNLLFVVMLMIGGVIVEAAVSWVQSILFI